MANSSSAGISGLERPGFEIVPAFRPSGQLRERSPSGDKRRRNETV